MRALTDVVYTVNRSDTLVAVNEAWTVFAAENDGGRLLPRVVLGRSLWDFIDDGATKHLYRQLCSRVRAGIGPVRFSLRCDSPGMRRLLEMSITPETAGGLTFVVRPVQLERRTPVPLLDTGMPRSIADLRMCSWCQRIRGDGGEWLEIEEALQRLALFHLALLPRISHGICEECTRAMTAVLDDPVLAASGEVRLGAFTPA
ncbi:MAG: hypothetical protein ABI742_13485 [Gemmatimonadota bacterium]